MKKFALLPLFVALSACTAPTFSTNTAHLPQELRFDPNHYTTLTISANGQSLSVRAFENIRYLSNLDEPEYQLMNIYIPESYFTGGTINGHTAQTAPIFFPNAVGGYMPAKPLKAQATSDQTATQTSAPSALRPNSVNEALMRGYVVASSGARGRTLGANGHYTGKAPAVIVDLKAAIRYLKANDELMAGRADRIITNGTSAGGAMSALLGASGGSRDFDDELAKVGALMARDDVFAVSAYCPITNLENADMAYEWQFNGVNDYQKMNITMLDYHVKREKVHATLSDEQKRWSDELKQDFSEYVNSLHLIGQHGQTLRLDSQGNGTFKDEVVDYLNQSANRAFKQGMALNSLDFLAQRKSANPYYVADYQGYIRHLGRGKGVPAFDDVKLASGENELFGSNTINQRHFTAFGQKYGQGQMAQRQTVHLMNAMNYIKNSPTQYWRIRHGTQDNDTSLAISVILATSLSNHGKDVDFALPWGMGHSGDYDLDELFAWIDQLVKNNP